MPLSAELVAKHKLESKAIAVPETSCDILFAVAEPAVVPTFAVEHQQYKMFLERSNLHLFKILTPFTDGMAAFYGMTGKE